MRTQPFKLLSMLAVVLIFSQACSSPSPQPLIKTSPEVVTDTSAVTITANANEGNKGLLNYKEPVYVYLGLITDSSANANAWRYTKFKWDSTENAALATVVEPNVWSYKIPNIRNFFGVQNNEKITELVILFKQAGACADTCKVLRNADQTDIHIPVAQNR